MVFRRVLPLLVALAAVPVGGAQPTNPPAGMGWSGSLAAAKAGSTAASWREQLLSRINWARTTAGLAPVKLDREWTALAQEAALLIGLNQKLSHHPTPDWRGWSQLRAAAAAGSNLLLGLSNSEAIDAMLDDDGDNNTSCGHRNWLLLPQLERVGIGGVEGFGKPAVAVFVRGALGGIERPQVRDGIVAWPSKGPFPIKLVPDRWTVSVPDADLSKAEIRASIDGRPLEVKLVNPVVNLYHERILVFSLRDQGQPVRAKVGDQIAISVQNTVVNGEARNFEYRVDLVH